MWFSVTVGSASSIYAAVVGASKAGAAGGPIASLAAVGVIVAYETAQWALDPVAVEYRSEAVMEIDDEQQQLNVFMLEGTATIHSSNQGEPVSVTAGNATSVSADGQISAPAAYEPDQLPPEWEIIRDWQERRQQGDSTTADQTGLPLIWLVGGALLVFLVVTGLVKKLRG